MDLQLNALWALDHLDAVDLSSVLDDAFGERKASAKSSRSAGVASITACEMPL